MSVDRDRVAKSGQETAQVPTDTRCSCGASRSADSPTDSLAVSVLLGERIEAVCSEFERAWNMAASPADSPSLEQYLSTSSGPERTALLAELLMLDLEYQWRHGMRPKPESYQERFPGDAEIIAQAFAWLGEVEDSLSWRSSRRNARTIRP
jgi:hypothetical protein